MCFLGLFRDKSSMRILEECLSHSYNDDIVVQKLWQEVGPRNAIGSFLVTRRDFTFEGVYCLVYKD